MSPTETGGSTIQRTAAECHTTIATSPTASRALIAPVGPRRVILDRAAEARESDEEILDKAGADPRKATSDKAAEAKVLGAGISRKAVGAKGLDAEISDKPAVGDLHKATSGKVAEEPLSPDKAAPVGSARAPQTQATPEIGIQ